MNKRELRKLKQAGRREARREIQARFKTFEEHLKPKPRWIPLWLYRKVMRIFLDI